MSSSDSESPSIPPERPPQQEDPEWFDFDGTNLPKGISWGWEIVNNRPRQAELYGAGLLLNYRWSRKLINGPRIDGNISNLNPYLKGPGLPESPCSFSVTVYPRSGDFIVGFVTNRAEKNVIAAELEKREAIFDWLCTVFMIDNDADREDARECFKWHKLILRRRRVDG